MKRYCILLILFIGVGVSQEINLNQSIIDSLNQELEQTKIRKHNLSTELDSIKNIIDIISQVIDAHKKTDSLESIQITIKTKRAMTFFSDSIITSKVLGRLHCYI